VLSGNNVRHIQARRRRLTPTGKGTARLLGAGTGHPSPRLAPSPSSEELLEQMLVCHLTARGAGQDTGAKH